MATVQPVAVAVGTKPDKGASSKSDQIIEVVLPKSYFAALIQLLLEYGKVATGGGASKSDEAVEKLTKKVSEVEKQLDEVKKTAKDNAGQIELHEAVIKGYHPLPFP